MLVKCLLGSFVLSIVLSISKSPTLAKAQSPKSEIYVAMKEFGPTLIVLRG